MLSSESPTSSPTHNNPHASHSTVIETKLYKDTRFSLREASRNLGSHLQHNYTVADCILLPHYSSQEEHCVGEMMQSLQSHHGEATRQYILQRLIAGEFRREMEA